MDNTTYTNKTIVVTMNSDHEVSALFKLPVLTIYTTEPDTEIRIRWHPWGMWQTYFTNSSGYLKVSLPTGNYTLKATKRGYYSVTEDITLTGDRSIDIEMNKIVYVTPPFTPFTPQMYRTTWFSAELPYSSYYTERSVDSAGVFLVEIVRNKTGIIKITVHWNTSYPIIEIESSNIAVLRFNLTELYEHYYEESYLEKVEHTKFTGFRLDSNVPIVFEFGMPEPKELWKTTPEGTMIQLTDWSYENSTVLMSFEPGDPTVSMIFGDNYTNYHSLLEVQFEENAYPLSIHSNSTISNVSLNESEKSIDFNVSGPGGSMGCCIVKVPKNLTQDLWNCNYTVLLDGEAYPFENWTDTENTYIYVKYTHSEHKITIIPEFSSFLILPLFMVATLLIVIVYRRKPKS